MQTTCERDPKQPIGIKEEETTRNGRCLTNVKIRWNRLIIVNAALSQTIKEYVQCYSHRMTIKERQKK